MIVSRIANESIWNMNETEDSNKTEMKYAKKMKQYPNMLEMMKIISRNKNNRNKAIFKSWCKIDPLRLVKSESGT